MGRIQGLTEMYLTGDAIVKAVTGELHSVTLAWSGASAGDQVTFRDGTDGNAGPEVVFIAPTAHGTLTKEWPQGKRFDAGIFVDFQGNGKWHVELTFK